MTTFQEDCLRHSAHYKSVLAKADDLYLEGGNSIIEGLAMFDLNWVNIQFANAWSTKCADKDKQAAELCSTFPNAGAYLLALRQNPQERIQWLESALSSSQYLKDRHTEGLHLGNLGNAFYHLGEYRKAISFYKRRLIIAIEIKDRPGEGNVLGNLGRAYAALSEPRRAIEFFKQALTFAREDGDKRKEGVWLSNLGLAYPDLGDFDKAIGAYKQALTIDQAISDSRGEGVDLGNLGLAYASLGENQIAIDYYLQALALAKIR